MVLHGIHFPPDTLAAICRRYGAASLSLFGSILRDDFQPDSDIDLLVEFHPHTRIGLIGIARMEADLSEALGRRVDLRTPAELSPYFREQVVAGARLLQAA